MAAVNRPRIVPKPEVSPQASRQPEGHARSAAVLQPATPSDAPAPTESVKRPDGGLAAGRWEAPPWAFALVAALAVVGSLVWLAIALRTRRRQP